MTRINLIEVNQLTDQHLLAEYRELPRIFGLVRKKLQEKKEIRIGTAYKMWAWHVIFFFDKLWFLQKRLEKIIQECQKRNFQIQFTQKFNLDDIPEEYKKDFTPTEEEKAISQWRISEKIKSKPWFYKYYWKPLPHNFLP